MTEEAFTNAVKRNSRRLYLIALTFTKNHHDAEDIVQSTFEKLWRRDDPFDSETHLEHWLTVVCVNKSKDLIKSFFRSNRVALEDAADLYSFDRPQDFDLFAAVMSLPKNERTVIHLFYFEDLSLREIAALLKISEAAVGTRLSRARNHMKTKLGDDWIHE